MKIGLSFDLKDDSAALDSNLPDDFQEEFDSPGTIEAIALVLRGLGHDVMLLGNGRQLLQRVLADPPDLVFNVAEGRGISRCREARVPAALEMLDIPCTGSDPLTLAATLDKVVAKRLVAADGLAVPRGIVVDPNADPRDLLSQVTFPALAKPAWEGSSKGIRSRCLVQSPCDLVPVVESLRRDHRQPILVEEFVDGEEVTVGMVGNDSPEIVAIMRVSPKEPAEHFVYSLEIKRDFRRLVDYEVPACLPLGGYQAVEQAARKAFRALGCRDVARIDFRYRQGVPYFLEVNPLPGLNPDSSDLCIMADLAGWTYPQLIERILTAALQRLGLESRQASFIPASEGCR